MVQDDLQHDYVPLLANYIIVVPNQHMTVNSVYSSLSPLLAAAKSGAFAIFRLQFDTDICLVVI